jgi:hypothetical protein
LAAIIKFTLLTRPRSYWGGIRFDQALEHFRQDAAGFCVSTVSIVGGSDGYPGRSRTLLTVLTVSSVLSILMILLPARPSRVNAMSMPAARRNV